MKTSTSLKSCFTWKIAVATLVVVVLSTQAIHLGSTIYFVSRVIILPGVIADMLLSGNVHSGFASPILDYVIGIGAAWLFWTMAVVLAKWIYLKSTAQGD